MEERRECGLRLARDIGEGVTVSIRGPDCVTIFRFTAAMFSVFDGIGYLPFEPEAAKLFFQLISARYERACVIVTISKPFSR